MTEIPVREAPGMATHAVQRRRSTGTSTLIPREPNSIEETGLSIVFLSELVLKHTYFAGALSGQQLGDATKLPFLNVIDRVLFFVKEDGYIDIIGSEGVASEA